MRYRRLDEFGDMTFGQGQGSFWINQPEAVAQLVLTRLRLSLGEWFYDTSDGTPWATEVLGERTQATRDIVVLDRVRDTTGVLSVDAYGSVFDPNTREWTAALRLTTVYGPVAVAAARLPGSVPPLPAAPAGVQPIRMQAQELGILGGTAIGMTPADLTQPGRVNIADFAIQALEAGTY